MHCKFTVTCNYQLWDGFDLVNVSSVYCSSVFRVGSYLWVYDLQVCRDVGKKKKKDNCS